MAGIWTPERKAEASRRAKERWARDHAQPSNENPFAGGPPPASPVLGSPAILPEWRQFPVPYFGQRTVKMLRPVCATCQDRDNVPPLWFLACEHDPYITLSPRIEKVPVYEAMENGRQRVVREDTVRSFVPLPNRVEMALTPKVNGGKGVEIGRGRGFILPSELRSPHFPDGIADACEYRECYKQTDLKLYGEMEEDFTGIVGTFCRRQEAALVWKAENPDSGAIEIGFDQPSRRRRRMQLEEARV